MGVYRPDMGGMESSAGDAAGRRGEVSSELSCGSRCAVLLRTAEGETGVKTRPRTRFLQSSFLRWSWSSMGARCADTKVSSSVEPPPIEYPIRTPTAPLLPISHTPTPTPAVSSHRTCAV